MSSSTYSDDQIKEAVGAVRDFIDKRPFFDFEPAVKNFLKSKNSFKDWEAVELIFNALKIVEEKNIKDVGKERRQKYGRLVFEKLGISNWSTYWDPLEK